MLESLQKYFNQLSSAQQIKFKNLKIFNRYILWFRSSFPESTLVWLQDAGMRTIVIRLDEQSLAVSLWQENQKTRELVNLGSLAKDDMTSAIFLKKLESFGFDRATTKIVLEIRINNFFVRDFTIPKSANKHIDQILLSEIERKTPFKLTDVFTTYLVDKKHPDPTKNIIHQWIIRKDILQKNFTETGFNIHDIDAIRPFIVNEKRERLPEIVLEKKQSHSNKFGSFIKITLSSALIILIISSLILFLKQERLSLELTERISSLSVKATRVRELADRASTEGRLLVAVREAKKAKYTFVDILAEVSKILPDGSFISEIRLTEISPGQQSVDIFGFSDSALKLPALFDKSSIFTDATLTAPIMKDPNEKIDSFSLQVKIKPAKKGQ